MLLRYVHDWIAARVFQPLFYAQQLVRPARREIQKARIAALRFQRAVRVWEGEEKREWILRQLRLAVRRAEAVSPYYQRVFAQTKFDVSSEFGFSDFARMPILERSDILRAKSELISTAFDRSELRRDATGGSTGQPVEVWLGPEEEGWRDASAEFAMEQVGVRAGARIGLLWGHHLDPVASKTWKDQLLAFVRNIRWYDCFRLSPDILDQYHYDLQRWRPECIVAYAGALGDLANHVLTNRYRPCYPTRCFVTGAEKLSDANRRSIEQAFGRPVHERYGSRDVGLMAFQSAPERSKEFEVNWAHVLVEPGSHDRESEILVTKLHADGMPMIRYRVGDIARFPIDSKPGYPALVLEEVVGRRVDRICFPNGKWLSGVQFPHFMKDQPIRDFMIVQAKDYSVELQLVTDCAATDARLIDLESSFRQMLPHLPVSVRLVERIPKPAGSKSLVVCSHVE